MSDDKGLIPIALQPFYKDEAEYRTELLLLVEHASQDEANKADMFEPGLTSVEAARRKQAMKDNGIQMARIMMNRVGKTNFAGIEELARAVKPHIRRAMTAQQQALWLSSGMDKQLFLEQMTAGIKKMTEEVLNNPAAPEFIKQKARETLAKLEMVEKLV